MDKEINQIKERKTADYLDIKHQDKRKQIICSYLQEMRQINNIPGDAGHFSRTETDSTDFENENLTTKIRRNRVKNPHFKKKKYSKIS